MASTSFNVALAYSGGTSLWDDFQQKICNCVNIQVGECKVEIPNKRKTSEYTIVALIKVKLQ
jgi:hypothetical protein